MGITSEVLDDTGITINCSDGSSWSLSPQQLLALYQANTDIAGLRNALLAQMNAVIGSQVDVTTVIIVFDGTTGQISDFESGGAPNSGSISLTTPS